MNESIYEALRKYEFNKTEPETLSKLVQCAIDKGKDLRGSASTLYRKATRVLNILIREGFLGELMLSDSEKKEYEHLCACGLDGSFQVVGGVGGVWHAPISCAITIFRDGIQSIPEVIVEAGIEDIVEREPTNVQSKAGLRMMAVESKAIKECTRKLSTTQDAVLFIDGPIIDPPFYAEEKYVELRCGALEECLEKGMLVIGIVKRIIGRLVIDHILYYLLNDQDEKRVVNDMFSDINLSSYVFTKMASDGAKNILYTKPFNMIHAKENEVALAYQKQGVEVLTLIMQKDFYSKPIRIEVAIKKGSNIDMDSLATKAVKTVCCWSPPRTTLPLPIILAHEKCNIRKGCAEVLYNEIMTRFASSDPIENIVKVKLFTEV